MGASAGIVTHLRTGLFLRIGTRLRTRFQLRSPCLSTTFLRTHMRRWPTTTVLVPTRIRLRMSGTTVTPRAVTSLSNTATASEGPTTRTRSAISRPRQGPATEVTAARDKASEAPTPEPGGRGEVPATLGPYGVQSVDHPRRGTLQPGQGEPTAAHCPDDLVASVLGVRRHQQDVGSGAQRTDRGSPTPGVRLHPLHVEGVGDDQAVDSPSPDAADRS